jgi:hypothetical protein
MSTENTPVESTEVDLDTFAAELFGRKEAAPVETTTEVEDTVEVESDASTEEDTHVDADDTSAPDDDDETSEDDDSIKEEAPKPKKNRTQERIDELTKNWRETERKLEEAMAKLAEKPTIPEPKTTPDTSVNTAPKPTDLNEDGTEKYPLGEFDPKYLTDFLDHRDAQREAARKEKETQEKQKAEREQAQTALQEEWNEKLTPAKERYPDFQEKGEKLLPVLEMMEEDYAEYFTNTIMEMDHGPDVFYYLANNPDEALKIIQSGAKKATLSLGRLEAKFAMAEAEKVIARPKVSQAPEPPQHLNKGSAVAPPAIRGDEKDVDLDAFSKALFAKKR